MSDGRGFYEIIAAGVLAIINVILGFIIFPLRTQVDRLGEQFVDCQRSHTRLLERYGRDIEYMRRDADKAEEISKAMTECMGSMKQDVIRLVLKTEDQGKAIGQLKISIEGLPDELEKRLNGRK